MMKRTIPLFMAFIFTFGITAHAQKNLRKAYVITLQHDTIHGYIEFGTDESNMAVCIFRTSLMGDEKRYLPGEIYGYRFIEEGRFYVSKEVEILKGDKKTVFLEFLLQGIKNLYYYKEMGEYYLVEDQEGEWLVMSKRADYYVGTKFYRDTRYIGVLKYAFSQHELSNIRVDKAQFDRRSMIGIAREYHERVCDDGSDCIIFEYQSRFGKLALDAVSEGFIGLTSGVQRVKFGMNFFASGGAFYHHMKFLNFVEAGQTINLNSLNPSFAAGAMLNLPVRVAFLSLVVEANYSRIASGTNYFVGAPVHHIYKTFSFNADNISGLVGLRLTFPYKKSGTAIEVGYIDSYYIDPATKYTSIRYFSIATGGYFTNNIQTDNYRLPEPRRSSVSVAVQQEYMIGKKSNIFARLSATTAALNKEKSISESLVSLRLGYSF
jgi:hypothetical protein